MSILVEIGGRLTAQSVCSSSAGSTGWALALGDFRPTPDRMVAVFRSGGFQGEAAPPIDRPTVQVIVRGAKEGASELEAKTDAVVTALHQFAGTLDGRVYVNLVRQSDVIDIGRDENQRPMNSVNFLTWRSRTT